MAGTDSFPAVAPTSRFQLLPSPVVAPGKCAVCGVAEGPVVDFGMTIQFYGAVLFCVTCMTEAAGVVNMVPRALLSAAEESLSQSFEQQIIARDLVVFEYDRYIATTSALSMLSDAVLSVGLSHVDVVAGQAAEASPTLFDDAGSGEPEDVNVELGDAGSPEQDDNTTGNEGPVGVPAGSVNGSSGFSL